MDPAQLDLYADEHDGAPTVAGLFAGIGGIEHGLRLEGFRDALLCEIDPLAAAVLRRKFVGSPLVPDIRKLRRLPPVDVISAGFPCQDLSQAGGKVGIRGQHSGLVDHLLRVLRPRSTKRLRWLVIENVPYMLALDRGHAMEYLTGALSHLGFTWAYRVVDARTFGIPQRRPRVYLVASRTEDPREVLFADEYGVMPVDDRLEPIQDGLPYGFYWTEGLRGVGWAGDSVPPIKGGSGWGIPSPPAVWLPKERFIGTIDIRDAERLQGFPKNWTKPAEDVPGARSSKRWKLVGNAVCVPVARWVGSRLAKPGRVVTQFAPWGGGSPWPKAAWGAKGKVFAVDASQYPRKYKYRGLGEFLKEPLKPLSLKATRGYLSRARQCPYRISRQFLADVEWHLQRMEQAGADAAVRATPKASAA